MRLTIRVSLRQRPTSPWIIPPTPTMQMPNVFVVPPEEDETPAWCFFDAENPAVSQVIEQPETSGASFALAHPDIYTSLYDASNVIMEANAASQWNSDNISVVDALISDDYRGEDTDSDTESEYDREEDLDDDPHSVHPTARHSSREMRNAADDSDVIEVVKVSRKTGMPDAADPQNIGARSQLKRSATLKSRASKVFRSLKVSLRSKSRTQEPPPLPTPAVQTTVREAETSDRAKSATISRRGSRTLSRLFTAPSLRSQTSTASFDDRPPMSLTDSTSAPSPPLSTTTHAPSKSLPRRPSIYSAFDLDDARLRAASPTPTIASTRSTTRRFSATLKSLFTFSPVPSTVIASPIIPDDSGRATPTLRSATSTPPSVMSSVLTSGPQTPTSTEETNSVRLISTKATADPAVLESMFDDTSSFYLGPGLGLNMNLESSASSNNTPRNSVSNSVDDWESVTPKRFSKADEDMDGDTSFEMRLDSLHFDSISFDADQFAMQLQDL